jgi:hypothetical protein
MRQTAVGLPILIEKRTETIGPTSCARSQVTLGHRKFSFCSDPALLNVRNVKGIALPTLHDLFPFPSDKGILDYS